MSTHAHGHPTEGSHLPDDDMTSRVRAVHEKALAEALDIIREAHPGASAVTLETSDQQNGYGFTISELLYPSGIRITPRRDLHRVLAVEDAVWPRLDDLPWNDLVGEDDHGVATLPL